MFIPVSMPVVTVFVLGVGNSEFFQMEELNEEEDLAGDGGGESGPV